MSMQISIDKLKESEKRFDAWSKKGKVAFKSATRPTEEKSEKRKKMIAATRQEPTDFAYERAIGKNDSVYSNFVELIAEAKKRVGRIVIKEGIKDVGYATGFLVAEDLLITNWHVFKAKEEVAQSEVQFFYELDTLGNPSKSISFKLNSAGFFYSNEALDYCFVAVERKDITDTINLSSIGYIFLDPSLGKLGNENEESMNIIHHRSEER